MRRIFDIKSLGAAALAAVALAVGAAPAGADEQQPLPPGEVYDYSCGRLGNDCGETERESRSRPRGPGMRASGRARVRCAGRAGREIKSARTGAVKRSRRCSRRSRVRR